MPYNQLKNFFTPSQCPRCGHL